MSRETYAPGRLQPRVPSQSRASLQSREQPEPKTNSRHRRNTLHRAAAGDRVTDVRSRDSHSPPKSRASFWQSVCRTWLPTATMRQASGRRSETPVSTPFTIWPTTGSAARPAAQVEATAQLFEGKVARYVFMSSVAAYGDGLNHHEGDALAPDDHPNPYTPEQSHERTCPVPDASAVRVSRW